MGALALISRRRGLDARCGNEHSVTLRLEFLSSSQELLTPAAPGPDRASFCRDLEPC